MIEWDQQTSICLLTRSQGVARIAYSAPPMGELTALPLTSWLHLRGPTSRRRGREGAGEETNEGEKEGRKTILGPQYSQQIDAPKNALMLC